MDLSFLPWLCCPFCGGSLQASGADRAANRLGYGVLTCYCGRYPVVAGIPVLKKDSSGATDRVIALIEAGRHEEALFALMPSTAPDARVSERRLLFARPLNLLKRLVGRSNAPRPLSRSEQAVAMLVNSGDQVTACDLLAFFFENKKDNYDYFSYRFGQPRYLVALSFASIVHLPNKPLLDLACGCGHITRSLVQQAKGQPVFGLDRFFLGLYVAKRWVAPQAQYVCCDADTSLPFSGVTFAAAICADAFHYFPNKTICIRELERLTREDGFFMLVWVHSANVRRPHDGLPLPPEGYQALVTRLAHRLVADSDVLTRYLQRKGPPLARSADTTRLAHEPLLSLVASHRGDVLRDYGAFEEWPHAEGCLVLNPLYVEQGRNHSGTICLRRAFPSAFYEEDHAEYKQYLPETVEVSLEVLGDLAQGKRTAVIEKLIERCVVLGMPERYR
jgi:ubiquinone/menaquinone biosynthesis C-methylase UbiE/uncharacterized protein YbaR (Trm112 family)